MAKVKWPVDIVTSRHQQPHWVLNLGCTLRVASQHSNQFGQRIRPASERLADQLDCHIPPFLNGTRHACLATPHSHQARNMTISRLWVNYQCAGLLSRPAGEPPMQRPGTNNPTGFWISVDGTLASQRSNQFGQRVRPASEKLAGQLDCHNINRTPVAPIQWPHKLRNFRKMSL